MGGNPAGRGEACNGLVSPGWTEMPIKIYTLNSFCDGEWTDVSLCGEMRLYTHCTLHVFDVVLSYQLKNEVIFVPVIEMP